MTTLTITSFNYEKALAAVANNPFAKAFLVKNRSRLEALGGELGQLLLVEILDLFAAGKNREAWQMFYGPSLGSDQPASWAILAQGAATDVINTADMAQRWADAGAFIRECGIAATKALLAIVVAGFCV